MISPVRATIKPAPDDRRTSTTFSAKALRTAQQLGVIGKRVLRLGNADRQTAVAHLFKTVDFAARFSGILDLRRAVNFFAIRAILDRIVISSP